MSGVIDLFAGPGGFDQGLKMLGETDVVGIDSDAWACATAMAAEHDRLVAELGARPQAYGEWQKVNGVVAGPPCPGFSAAGLKLGRGDIPLILDAVKVMNLLRNPDETIKYVREHQADYRSALSLEPLRWVLDLLPEWAVFEQVPSVLPLWEACAVTLRDHGYAVWTGKVHAEQYGVPQTRTRAVLIADRRTMEDGATRCDGALAPVPTHSRYHPRSPAKRDEGVKPWVSMAEGMDFAQYPASRMRMTETWRPRPANEGTTAEDMAWVYKRPAPTMVGTFRPDVAAKPAWRKAGDTPRQKAPGSVLLTVAEAGVMQSFPADYPWQGSEAAQRLQIGNAIPPLLAAAILARVI